MITDVNLAKPYRSEIDLPIYKMINEGDIFILAGGKGGVLFLIDCKRDRDLVLVPLITFDGKPSINDICKVGSIGGDYGFQQPSEELFYAVATFKGAFVVALKEDSKKGKRIKNKWVFSKHTDEKYCDGFNVSTILNLTNSRMMITLNKHDRLIIVDRKT